MRLLKLLTNLSYWHLYVSIAIMKLLKFLLQKSLKIHTISEITFTSINEYLTELNFSWNKCVSFYSDGARATIGWLAGNDVITNILKHLQSLKSNISQYSPEDNSKIKWIMNPLKENCFKSYFTKGIFYWSNQFLCSKERFQNRYCLFWLKVEK